MGQFIGRHGSHETAAVNASRLATVNRWCPVAAVVDATGQP